MNTHVCLYPYSTAGLVRGWSTVTGMEALLAREIRLREGQPDLVPTTIISNGSETEQALALPDACVDLHPVAPELDPAQREALLAVWFDDLWALMHPSAFTSPALTGALASVVYPGPSDAPPGSFERVTEHIAARRRGRTIDPEQGFADRFESALQNIEPGATVGWTEVFFTESILRHAARLRSQGSRQSLHCFLAHPSSLHQSQEGRRILQAMSAMDLVYMQTDIYVRRLQSQLESLGLPIPEVRRFDLAPDSEALRKAVRAQPPDEAALRELDPNQRGLLGDAMRTRGQIPHRFVCPDRLDPIKGIHVVIEAVDQFLQSRGEPLDTLRTKYRFYFVTGYHSRFPPIDPSLAWHRYADWVRREQIPAFMSRWPGIVWFSDNIPDRQLWAHLLVDAHVISGGIQEGLGLAVQEGLLINVETGHERTVIVGDGAGFSIQVKEQGLGDHAHFPRAGDPDSLRQALVDVTSPSGGAGHLRGASVLVERFIEPHRDRLFDVVSQ